MDKKPKSSSDSEGVGCWGNSRLVVGYVSEVNGPDACDVPEFVPTKHELIQIAKYWLLCLLDNDFYFFVHGQTSSTEWRINIYSNRRINRIAEILPEQELNEALEEAERDFKQDKKISDDDWDVFKNGTQEQWDSYRERLWREFESQQSDPSPEGSKE